MNKIVSLLIFFNILGMSFLFVLGFKGKEKGKQLKIEELIIGSEDSKSYIHMKADALGATISILKDKKTPYMTFFVVEDEPICLLLDGSTNKKLTLKSSGVFLQNKLSKNVVSLASMPEGEGAFGLANKGGDASMVIKGGNNTSIAMYGSKKSPDAVFGISKNITHLKMRGERGSILLHGGEKSGMMMLDEHGKMKIFICKEGIFQHQTEEAPKKEKFFSFNKEKEFLFPKDE